MSTVPELRADRLLQQRQRLLGLLVGGHILNDRVRLAVLRNDHRLALLCELTQDLGRGGLEVADRLHVG